MANEPTEVLVLLSGGIDSSACVDFFLDIDRPLQALFVDYGQPAAKAEQKAAERICEYFSVALRYSSYRPDATIQKSGMIPGRNILLLSAACVEADLETTVIGIGIHADTEYPDCTRDFLDAATELMSHVRSAPLSVSAPFLDWTKPEIVGYCHDRGIPLELTYSCEVGNSPCGHCKSCKDRKTLC